jgi:tetratricopeptide (TPR) repeat protein
MSRRRRSPKFQRLAGEPVVGGSEERLPPAAAETIGASSRDLPWWKRALFMACTLAVPLAALAVVEGGLRVAGYGGYPAFLRTAGTLPSGERVALVEPAASKPYFFANPTRPGYAEETNFLLPKPAGTLRIFLVGESAAKGFPQPRNLSMGSFLEAMLHDLVPDRRIEVINLGTTAVASFPLVYLVRDALRFEPDAFVFYVGNNEFFGAYGTASINAVGTLPTWALPLVRAARGLAVVQAVEGLVHRKADSSRTLMEEMVGRTSIPPDSPLRSAAARNLEAHLDRMLAAAAGAGVPAVVCTTASNESGLRPLGGHDPAEAAFARGAEWAAAGDRAAARRAFLEARDLDTMPWRPISATEEAIRRAAGRHGATLCDVAERFRDLDADGAPGWSLLDDHVHLSLRGQAEAARAMAEALVAGMPQIGGDAGRVARLPDWEEYSGRLGANDYDAYRVVHTLRVLFGVPFMRQTNPEAHARFEAACRAAEESMPDAVREVAREWQSLRPHAGGLRPLTGMVARVLLREGRVDEAERLFTIAQRQVPDYTSWYLEYVYFALACRERLGGLSEADRAEAQRAIDQGRFLLARGFSGSGLAERFVGRLHQLRGEWRESIAPLEAAQRLLGGTDRVACDQALVAAHLKLGDVAAAEAIVAAGERGAGPLAGAYRGLRAQLPSTTASPSPPGK